MENISTEASSFVYQPNNFDQDEETQEEFWIIFKVVPVVILTLVTLLGNGLVIVLFIRSKQLRKCKNIYIVSLAMADFLIGSTMPVYILEEIGLPLWTLQGAFCRIFLMVRYSLFYISLLSIMLISVDRWWSINHPFSYRVRQSRKLALWSVLCSWLLSFAIYAPPILGWEEVIGDSANEVVPAILKTTTTVTPLSSASPVVVGTASEPSAIPTLSTPRCRAPFENNLIFILLTAVILYLLPLLSLWVMNASIYFKISQRKGIKIRRSLSTSDTFFLNYRKSSSESDNMGQFDEFIDSVLPALYRKAANGALIGGNGVQPPSALHEDKRNSVFMPGPLSMRRNPLCQYVSTTPTFAQYARITQNKRHVSFDANGMFIPGFRQKRLSSFILTKGGSTSSNSSSSSTSSSGSTRSGLAFRRQSDDLVKDMFVKQDKKAACSLGFLVLVFTICWTPYTICSILTSAYGRLYIPSILVTISYCILVTNSAINPFLYGLCNSDFRKAFRSWCHDRSSKQRRFEEALLYYGLPQVYEPEIIPEQSTSTPTKEPKRVP